MLRSMSEISVVPGGSTTLPVGVQAVLDLQQTPVSCGIDG